MTRTNRTHASLGLCALLLACTGCGADTTPQRSGRGPANPDFGNAAAGGAAGTSGQAGIGADNPSGPPRDPGATNRPPADNTCAEISQTAENRLRPADIIFAVDNSGSMDEEIVFVREQLNAFSQQIVASGVDVRIILISAPVASTPPPPPSLFDDDDDQDNGICIAAPLGSGNCPDDSNLPRYLHVPTEVKSHDALNLFIETFPQWRAQLRPNASKTFVVVTDDNAEDEPNDSAAAFSASVGTLDAALFAEWGFSGIYCFSECPEAAEIGTVYQELVAQKKGVGGDLCLQNFAPVFDALAQAVIGASGIDCEWAIPPPPQGQTFDTARVNVRYTGAGAAPQTIFHVDGADRCAADGGWFYDQNAAPTKVLACPATCDLLRSQTDAKVDVLFGCETKNRPI